MKCHYTGMKKDCLEHGCHLWTRVEGKDPQTGMDINKWDCADAIVPLVILNLGRQIYTLGVEVAELKKTVEQGQQIQPFPPNFFHDPALEDQSGGS